MIWIFYLINSNISMCSPWIIGTQMQVCEVPSSYGYGPYMCSLCVCVTGFLNNHSSWFSRVKIEHILTLKDPWQGCLLEGFYDILQIYWAQDGLNTEGYTLHKTRRDDKMIWGGTHALWVILYPFSLCPSLSLTHSHISPSLSIPYLPIFHIIFFFSHFKSLFFWNKTVQKVLNTINAITNFQHTIHTLDLYTHT